MTLISDELNGETVLRAVENMTSYELRQKADELDRLAAWKDGDEYEIHTMHEGDPGHVYKRLINVSEEEAKREAKRIDDEEQTMSFIRLERVDRRSRKSESINHRWAE